MSSGGDECSLVSLRSFSKATTPDYRILVKRDRTKANYALTARLLLGGFARTIMIAIREMRSNQRSGRKAATWCITLGFALAALAFGAGQVAHAQGMATGGTAVPARPLPPGMKAPVVRYEDVAARAGLVGINVSGAERGKQIKGRLRASLAEAKSVGERHDIGRVFVSGGEPMHCRNGCLASALALS